MYNKYLATVYRSIYGENFSNDSKRDRTRMQRTIFLLAEHGTSLGDYDFSWYGKNGLWSIALDDDLCDATHAEEIAFSSDAQSSINKIRDLIHTKTDYSMDDWIDCLVMLLHLRKYVMSSYLNDSIICNDMSCKHPHLNHSDTNKTAIKLLRETFAL